MEETQQSVWNFDGAELYAIFEIKKEFIGAMVNWNLEDAYWKVRTLRMELDAKLKREKKKILQEIDEKKGKGKVKTEKQECDEKMKWLDDKRKEFNNDSIPGDEDKSKFYLALEEFYMYLCYLMKRHGLYFREGEDMTLAVLRR